MSKSTKARTGSRLDWFRITLFGKELPLYWTWIALAVLVVASHLLLRLQLKEATFQFLDNFADIGEGTFRDSSYSIGGTVESTGIELMPYEAEGGDQPIRIGRIAVETPGPFWLLRASLPSFDPKPKNRLARGLKNAAERFGEPETPNLYPAADRLSVRFEDVDWGDWGMHWVLPGIDWIGPYSGALFEAAGCERDWWWTRDETRNYFAAGAADGTITMDFEVTGPATLTQRAVFGTEGLSRITIEQHFKLPGDADDFLDIDPSQWHTTLVRWTVEDAGFVRARNRYCARQSRISEPEFVARHLASVRRILLANGAIPDAALLDTYRGYAERGGKLVWQTNLPPGRSLEDFDGHSEEAWMIGVNASLSVQDKTAAYQLLLVDPVPFPEADLDSVYAVLSRDPAGAPSTLPPAAAPQAGALAADSMPAPADSVSASAATAAVPTVPTTVAESTAETPRVPSVRDLPKLVGRYLRLTLSNGRRYVGVLERADAGSVSLKIAVTGGSASLGFRHERIAEIQDLGPGVP